MDELDGRPPVPHICFESGGLPVGRRLEVAALTVNLLRAAAGDDAFAELWLAETLGDAMVDADTAALVLCDLADLAVMLTKAIAGTKDVPASEVLGRVADSWEAQTA